MTQIIKNIETAVKELLGGSIVALPTETVYGLGANALDADAALKIFEAKQRPRFNPLIVHVKNVTDFEKYAEDIPDDVYKLAEKFSPGPISYIVKKKKIIPDIITSGSKFVALRVPSHELFRKVLEESGIPVCAPSANRFSGISPVCAEDVMKELGGKINYILDGGKSVLGIESTVVNFTEEGVEILRNGFITKEEIEKVIGKTISGFSEKNISPGMLKVHYAPEKPMYFVKSFDEVKHINDRKIGLLDFSGYKDSREIALNLFSDLRNLDEMNIDFIVCKKTEESGLGVAINERLEKAAKGYLPKELSG